MENRDEKLWRTAAQRVKFRGHVMSYLLVNAFLWLLWYFTGQHERQDSIPWPAWVSLGWGFGLVMKYIKVYHLSTEDQVQKEYDKLRNQQ